MSDPIRRRPNTIMSLNEAVALHHEKYGRRCPKWVIRVVLAVRRLLPVYPDERTCSESVGMSQTCHISGSRIHSGSPARPNPFSYRERSSVCRLGPSTSLRLETRSAGLRPTTRSSASPKESHYIRHGGRRARFKFQALSRLRASASAAALGKSVDARSVSVKSAPARLALVRSAPARSA